MNASEAGEHPLPALVGQIAGPVLPGFPFALRLPRVGQAADLSLAGRYFLLRCSDDTGVDRGGGWTVFLRRALFVWGCSAQGEHDLWKLIAPSLSAGSTLAPACAGTLGREVDPGLAWLSRLQDGDLVNLLGPYGNGFSLPRVSHNLLLAIDLGDAPSWFWRLAPLCEQTLDRGGRVTVLLRAAYADSAAGLARHLPIQVELRVAASEEAWLEALGATVGWADRICAGVPPSRYAELMRVVREKRIHVEESFIQVLVRADLLCGVGACLACVVPTVNDGLARACVRGPVFDLPRLVD